MNDIIPAIIPDSFSFIETEVSLVKDDVTKVQIDISDGLYTKNKTWPYRGDSGEWEQLVREEKGLPFWEDLEYEFHLMVLNPDEVLGDYIHAGASSIVVHIDKIKDIKIAYEICQSMQVTLVLALLPKTNIEEIKKYIGFFDALQCMGSNRLGFHGESLDEKVFSQIRELRELFPSMPISVDIGVTEDTIDKLREAGATVFVSGSSVFGGR